MIKKLACAIAGIAALWCTGAAAADYSVRNLTATLPPSVQWSRLNNAGDVLGSYGSALYQTAGNRLAIYASTSSDVDYLTPTVFSDDGTAYFTESYYGGSANAFRRAGDGTVTPLYGDNVAYIRGVAAVGRDGTVAGNFIYGCGGGRCDSTAVLYRDGELQSLGTLGGATSTAYAMNNQGIVVGSSLDSRGVDRAFVYSGGQMYSIGANRVAQAVNDAGQVGGTSYFVGDDGVGTAAAFLYHDALTTSIQVAGANRTEFVDLNNAGQALVRGYSGVASIRSIYLYDEGGLTNLDDLLAQQEGYAGWHVENAYDINDMGQILVSAYSAAANASARLVLTPGEPPVLLPVPEPATYAMLLAGLGLVGRAARRKRA